MYKSVIFSPAKDDILDIYNYYEDQKPGLGDEFWQVLFDKVDFLCQNPNAAETKYRGTRKSPLKKFPYTVHYIKDDVNKRIIVFSVIHNSVQPRSSAR